jgi:hypothetical protein
MAILALYSRRFYDSFSMPLLQDLGCKLRMGLEKPTMEQADLVVSDAENAPFSPLIMSQWRLSN